MSRQVSFNEHEREILPGYRASIDAAESVEDVRKFFERTVLKFLDRALGPEFGIRAGDVLFSPGAETGYVLGPALQEDARFKDVQGSSDLGAILDRLADRALKRHRRLAKGPDKTEAKMYPVPGRR